MVQAVAIAWQNRWTLTKNVSLTGDVGFARDYIAKQVLTGSARFVGRY